MPFRRKSPDTVSNQSGPLGSLVRAAPLSKEPELSTTRSTNRPPTTQERGWSARLNRWRDTWTTTNEKDSPPSQNQADTPTNKGTSRSISSVASQIPALTSPGGTNTDETHTKRTSVNLQSKDDYVEQSSRQTDLEQHTNARLAMSEVPSRPWAESTSDEEMSQSNTRPKEEVWYDAQQSHD